MGLVRRGGFSCFRAKIKPMRWVKYVAAELCCALVSGKKETV
jgi:hypothetical protein